MLYVKNTSFTPAVRTEKLDGREYLVAPVSMLVSGVLNGSQGRLFYPKDEIEKSVFAWNDVPLTAGHPTNDEGRGVSARSPSVIKKYGIGRVFNASFQDGKLAGEAWFDKQKTKEIQPGILQKLTANEPIESSTGLFTENEKRGGMFNGKQFDAIARDYQPDHFAVLLDGKGACSIDDGCGVLNEEDELDDELIIYPDDSVIITNTIRKEGGKYVIYSKSGKKLGTFDTEEAAKKRLRQIEAHKHMNKNECECGPDCDCEGCKERFVKNQCPFKKAPCSFIKRGSKCPISA